MTKWCIAVDDHLILHWIRRLSVLAVIRLLAIGCLWCAAWPQECRAGERVPENQQDEQNVPGRLTHLSLEQLGNTEVTSVSKEPVKITLTPAAIYVITQEDIRRSGASSLPELLRLVPGVEVARIDSSKWSLGVRGFGSRLSRAVLVLIDGRSVLRRYLRESIGTCKTPCSEMWIESKSSGGPAAPSGARTR